MPDPWHDPRGVVTPDLERFKEDVLALERTSVKLAALVRSRRDRRRLRDDDRLLDPHRDGAPLLPRRVRSVTLMDGHLTTCLPYDSASELTEKLVRRTLNVHDRIIAIRDGVASDLTLNFAVESARVTTIWLPIDLARIEALAKEPQEPFARPTPPSRAGSRK